MLHNRGFITVVTFLLSPGAVRVTRGQRGSLLRAWPMDAIGQFEGRWDFVGQHLWSLVADYGLEVILWVTPSVGTERLVVWIVHFGFPGVKAVTRWIPYLAFAFG